jgi:hypothetical protein
LPMKTRSIESADNLTFTWCNAAEAIKQTRRLSTENCLRSLSRDTS